MKKAKKGFPCCRITCFPSCLKRLKKFFRSKYFFPSIILLVLLIVALITAVAMQKPIRERAKAGGTCLPAGQTKIANEPNPPPCCPGLSFIRDTKPSEQGVCTAISSGEVPTLCSNCGNGSCESWENHCNCSLDCPEQSRVQLKIKFQCINKKPAKTSTQKVKMTLLLLNQTSKTGMVEFSPQDDGTYLGYVYASSIQQVCGGIAGLPCPSGSSCQLLSNDPDASGVCISNTQTIPKFTLLVKGPKHLQRKFEFEDITLTPGPTIDLTSKIMESGDLPVQNGKVDRGDYDTLVAKVGQTYSEDFDINMDGAINMVDVSCLIDTLSVKQEEE
jgi:hypothetical protein